MKWLFSICLLGLSILAQGQIVIGSNTKIDSDPSSTLVTNLSVSSQADIRNLKLVLSSTQSKTFSAVGNPISVNNLTINGGNYAILGDVTVTEALVFTAGNLIVDKVASAGTLTYTGAKDLEGSDKSYVNGRLFIQGSGIRTFPIGNATGYFPARLDGVSAADASIPLGLEVISANPGFVKTPDLKDIFTSHFWEFSTGGTGVFSGNTQISLSDNTGGFFGTDGDATILELSTNGAQTDLFGSPNNSFYTSSSPMSASGKYYGLAKADQITVRIRKLITPNDDQENDVLVVDGLDAFPDNQITLIDRWGVVVKTWKGFVNYTEPAGVEQSDFNFAKLAIGNYVCVVEYTERGTRKSKKQMIAVLK
jgi:gliding motility-associated-like protein